MARAYNELEFTAVLTDAMAKGATNPEIGENSTARSRARSLVRLLRASNLPLPAKDAHATNIFLAYPVDAWLQVCEGPQVRETNKKQTVGALMCLKRFFEKTGSIKGSLWATAEADATLKKRYGELCKKEQVRYFSEKMSDKERENWIDWKYVVEICETRWSLHRGKLDGLVASLYTLFPPRRLQDYSIMKISRDPKVLTENREFNWLFLSENGIPQKFVFNHFKSKGTCGAQTYLVDHFQNHPSFKKLHEKEKLSDRIATYLQSNGIDKDGDWMLKLDSDNPDVRSQSLNKILTRIYSHGASMLRHEFVASLNHATMTFNSMQEITRAMAHSLKSHFLYRREGKGTLAVEEA
jgi:hypothetical protein